MVADGLDYFAAPIFSSPLVGDVFDSIINKHFVLHNKEQTSNFH